MTQVVSFEDYTPPARFDAIPWSEVRIEQSDTTATPSATTVWTQIDVVALSPLDSNPAIPASRGFTTHLASDTPDLWYRAIFADANNSTTLPSVPVQNQGLSVSPYATTDELFRVLKVRTPTSDQTIAAHGDLDTATIEINAEIDLADDAPPLTGDELELCRGVCIDRAADLWRHRESAPGILGVVDEAVPSSFGRYSWERYAQRLSPLKGQWGIA
jgi:hypothetical protein